MSRSFLLLSSTTSLLLESTLSQDTGGPYTGTVSVSGELSGSCIDNRGQVIQEGRLFEPGPDECQVCTCLRKLPVLCRTVLCAPPQGCRSLRVGDACCEWVCDKWDDSVNGSVSDLGLRLMASAITAIFSLSLLFFLIYRLRQRKLRGRQNHFEAEGYSQDEVIDEVPGHSFPFESMKPQDRVMMRRPFPPSYSEAMYGLPTENLDVSTEQNAPSYNSIHQDPVISYPVATLGRLVLPAFDQNIPSSSTTLPSSLRRVLRRQRERQNEEVGNANPQPIEVEVSHDGSSLENTDCTESLELPSASNSFTSTSSRQTSSSLSPSSPSSSASTTCTTNNNRVSAVDSDITLTQTTV